MMGWDGDGMKMHMKPLPLTYPQTLQRSVPVIFFTSPPRNQENPFFSFISLFFSQSFSPFAGPDGVYEQQPSSGEW